MLFWGLLIIECLGLVSLFWSRSVPEQRIWPPPSKKSWQFWFTWISVIAITIGLILLGWQRSDPSQLIQTWSGVIGLICILTGLLLAVVAVVNLGVDTSAGLEGELITSGIYSYTRNPQYLGDIMIIFGWCLIVGHWQIWTTGFFFASWFAFAPFVEEPWLEKRFGEDYKRYCEEVPRFL